VNHEPAASPSTAAFAAFGNGLARSVASVVTQRPGAPPGRRRRLALASVRAWQRGSRGRGEPALVVSSVGRAPGPAALLTGGVAAGGGDGAGVPGGDGDGGRAFEGGRRAARLPSLASQCERLHVAGAGRRRIAPSEAPAARYHRAAGKRISPRA